MVHANTVTYRLRRVRELTRLDARIPTDAALLVLTEDLGVRPGDRVATFGHNSIRHFERYYAVPLVGGILHTLNVRLLDDQIAWIANHAEDSVLLAAAELAGDRIERVVLIDGALPIPMTLPPETPIEEAVRAEIVEQTLPQLLHVSAQLVDDVNHYSLLLGERVADAVVAARA